MFDEFGINAGLVEELHTQWLQSPQSVDEEWRRFFEGTTGKDGPAGHRGHRRPRTATTAKAKVNGNGTPSVRPAARARRVPRRRARERHRRDRAAEPRRPARQRVPRARAPVRATSTRSSAPAGAAPELELANFGLERGRPRQAPSRPPASAGLPERATLARDRRAPAARRTAARSASSSRTSRSPSRALAPAADGVDAQPRVARPAPSCFASSPS